MQTLKSLPRYKFFLLFFAVPLTACIVAARQGYLNAYHHLSTWKGGGMGMFAGADSGDTRFARIFIEMADGQRQPVIGVLPAQTMLLQKAIWYPTASNFLPLAESLRRTAFVASQSKSDVFKYTSKRQRAEKPDGSHYLLHARGPRPDGDTGDWTLIIEYWEISYDAVKLEAKATLAETMRFAKEDSR